MKKQIDQQTPFEQHLRKQNLSENTVTSYLWTIKYYTENYEDFSKENLLAYKGWLLEYFKPKTVNLRIQAINKYLVFTGKDKMQLKQVKVQQKNFLENVISNFGYVFLNRFGERITTRGIATQLKTYAAKYGISTKVVYPHSFRHRYAKNFLEKFNDISLLADLMGHESIETTRIYLRRTASEQQEIVDQIVTW